MSEAPVDGIPRREKLPRGPGQTYCGLIVLFSLRELNARVRALMRRSARPDERVPAAYKGAHLLADFDAVVLSG